MRVGDAERALGLAALAGVASYAACFLPDGVGARWGAGLAFGALVLAPCLRATRDRGLVILLSIAVYRAAVWLADRLHVDAGWPALLACSLAGAGGALMLALASRALPGLVSGARGTALAAGIGALAGALIGLAVDAPDGSLRLHLLLLAGFVVWQVGYTAAQRLHPAPRAAG